MKTLIAVCLLSVAIPLTTSTLNICYKPNVLTTKDLKCLAANVYHEARGEPYAGKILVARTVLNRVYSNKYPDSVCSVVFQKKQFSWTLKTKKIIYDDESWAAAYNSQWSRSEATHFHATYVRPKWAEHMIKLQQVGNHIFYVQKHSRSN